MSGDAYVDHPSFAAAILGRVLEAAGYRVGIVAQPRWAGPGAAEDLLRVGTPRLAWLLGAGSMDSMVAHYTANKKPRSEDAYSPGGTSGLRPDRALIAYSQAIRAVSKGVPLIVGGIEASLRRFAHYDYWSDTVRRSILLDAKADLLVYGMAEETILEIAERLAREGLEGNPAHALRGIRGTCWRTGKADEVPCEAITLPTFAETRSDAAAYSRHFVLQETNADPVSGRALVERTEDRFVVQEPPALPLSQPAFDRAMELPYARAWHPDYDAAGGVPALAEVQFSLTSSRGCFGACAFCAITFHQGRQIQARSAASLVREAATLTKLPGFKGYIHDLGGPTANFRVPSCAKQAREGSCPDRQCLGASPCPALKPDHTDYLATLRAVRAVPGVRKVFVRSGIRYDYVMLDPARDAFIEELALHHVSGQLKVAPEHASDRVLAVMRKGTRASYLAFRAAFAKANERLALKQYLVPYYIAAHPGATLADAVENALALREDGFVPDQVQDFYPTPGTLATAIYHTGIDPYTGEPVPVARGAHERALHRALLQFNKKENRPLVLEALRAAHREDAIPLLTGGNAGRSGAKRGR